MRRTPNKNEIYAIACIKQAHVCTRSRTNCNVNMRGTLPHYVRSARVRTFMRHGRVWTVFVQFTHTHTLHSEAEAQRVQVKQSSGNPLSTWGCWIKNIYLLCIHVHRSIRKHSRSDSEKSTRNNVANYFLGSAFHWDSDTSDTSEFRIGAISVFKQPFGLVVQRELNQTMWWFAMFDRVSGSFVNSNPPPLFVCEPIWASFSFHAKTLDLCRHWIRNLWVRC